MISAVIPVYREPKILEFRDRLIRALTRKGMPYHWEIIWCTGDPLSFNALLNVVGRNERIVHESERGLGRAIRLGFQNVNPNTDWILTMDSDLQQLPEELPIFWNMSEIYPKPDCIVGKYTLKDERSRWRKLISKLATWIISTRHGLGLSNITSNYRLYDAIAVRRMMNSNPPKANDFEIQPEILIRLRHACLDRGISSIFKNVDISFPKREAGESHARLRLWAYLRLLFL
jgi:glycosyltransferase involved in cell wall biosynthesis